MYCCLLCAKKVTSQTDQKAASFRLTFAPVSVFCFNLDRCDKMAVQSLLLHTTASPVCIWLGSVNVLNFTAMTLVSACLAVRPLPVAVPNK